jgi:hypothetical protein
MASFKRVSKHINIAKSIARADTSVAYYVNLYVIKQSSQITNKSQEDMNTLMEVMTWLEQVFYN